MFFWPRCNTIGTLYVHNPFCMFIVRYCWFCLSTSICWYASDKLTLLKTVLSPKLANLSPTSSNKSLVLSRLIYGHLKYRYHHHFWVQKQWHLITTLHIFLTTSFHMQLNSTLSCNAYGDGRDLQNTWCAFSFNCNLVLNLATILFFLSNIVLCFSSVPSSNSWLTTCLSTWILPLNFNGDFTTYWYTYLPS